MYTFCVCHFSIQDRAHGLQYKLAWILLCVVLLDLPVPARGRKQPAKLPKGTDFPAVLKPREHGLLHTLPIAGGRV